MKEIKVGIIGLGVVGTGAFNILKKNTQVIQDKLNCVLTVAQVADYNIENNKDVDASSVTVRSHGEDIVNDPDIDMVVELIGGYSKAKELILSALRNKKHVVTANKALLALYGEEIFEEAARNNVEIGFEAAVGGGIPVIKALKEGLGANNIASICGIINGTSNFILSKMTQDGTSFDEVLRDAQKCGYAEADPTFDVEGVDSAHKLVILADLAFSGKVNYEDLYVSGITGITPMDIEYAEEFGYRIKPLAIARMVDGKLEARVHPTMVSKSELLSQVDGVFNGVFISGDFVGDVMLYGKGAGRDATASAVAADVIDIARNIAAGSIRRVPSVSFNDSKRKNIKIRPMAEVESVYYLRFMVSDRPGVLSKIAGILGEHSISISKVLQKERTSIGKVVPVVIFTHKSIEKQLMDALVHIEKIEEVAEPPMLIRVEGDEI